MEWTSVGEIEPFSQIIGKRETTFAFSRSAVPFAADLKLGDFVVLKGTIDGRDFDACSCEIIEANEDFLVAQIPDDALSD